VATNLVARTRLSPAEVRRMLDHKVQPVRWRAARGGALGLRQPSDLKLERDDRVYLLPAPGVVVLTRPRHLGAKARAPAATTDLDRARADQAALPDWLRRAGIVDREAGTGAAGPIAVVSVAGIARKTLDVPQVGAVPTPARASLALEMARTGF